MRPLSLLHRLVSRPYSRPAGERLIWLAGLLLIAVGILCLCLSGAVFTGWWQSTLDAFGVGFTVGGTVDVLAITGLNQIIRTENYEQQENNTKARSILKTLQDPQEKAAQAMQAAAFLLQSGKRIDPALKKQLWGLVWRDVGPSIPPPYHDALRDLIGLPTEAPTRATRRTSR